LSGLDIDFKNVYCKSICLVKDLPQNDLSEAQIEDIVAMQDERENYFINTIKDFLVDETSNERAIIYSKLVS